MSRTVRSAQLETRAARLRLKPRKKPYRAASAKQGLHLGYRRIADKNGSWIAFTYQGSSGSYSERAFAQADDYSSGDAEDVLTYFEAMQRVSSEAPPIRHSKTYSVASAVEDYVAWLARHRKSAAGAKSNLGAYLTQYFGDRALASLTTADFEKWQEWAFTHKPRGRLKDGKQARKEKPPEIPAEERKRRRKSRINRVINDVLAALNYAFDQGRVGSRDAWARVRKYRGADSARIAHLSADEARRLINTCDADFRQLVVAALLTGCRYGELSALRARDYHSDSRTLLVAQSKSGKSRRVPLTDEGQRLFDSLTAGKGADDHVLTKADGSSWAKSEQFRRIREACAVAAITPSVNFHALRHTFATLLVQAGTPLAFVADALGHSDTRMVSKHYAHLAPNLVHDTIRANLPTFGVNVDPKLRKLRP
jgi:integrase